MNISLNTFGSVHLNLSCTSKEKVHSQEHNLRLSVLVKFFMEITTVKAITTIPAEVTTRTILATRCLPARPPAQARTSHHTHTYPHKHPHAQTPTRTNTHTHKHPHAQTPTHTVSHTDSRPHTHTSTPTHARSHAVCTLLTSFLISVTMRRQTMNIYKSTGSQEQHKRLRGNFDVNECR